MSKLALFFDELERLFLSSDKAAYYELKEDLLEHVSVLKSEGLSEAAIIERLGKPSLIAEAFYEEQRLHTALTAKTDVIPLEDVKSVYEEQQKEQFYKRAQKVIKSFSLMCKIFIGISGIYSLLYLVIEGLKEQHLARTPLILLISSLFLAFFFLPKKSGKRLKGQLVFGISSLILLIWTASSASFFYQGEKFTQVYQLTEANYQELTLTGDYPVDVIVLPVKESKDFKIEIKGYLKHSQKKQLTTPSLKQSIDLPLGKKGYFDLFTKPKNLEVIIHVPQETAVAHWRLNLQEAFIDLNQLKADSLRVSLEKGDFQGNNLDIGKIQLNSKKADLTLNNFQSALTIANKQGKTIVKRGNGDLVYTSQTGMINLNNVKGERATINNQSGKVIVAETEIANLEISSTENVIVLDHQIGHSQLELTAGKLIVTNHQGRLDVINQAASLIISQQESLKGKITNQQGLIKWVQNPESQMVFELVSPDSLIDNQYVPKKQKKSNTPYQIINQTGTINLYKKETD